MVATGDRVSSCQSRACSEWRHENNKHNRCHDIHRASYVYPEFVTTVTAIELLALETHVRLLIEHLLLVNGGKWRGTGIRKEGSST